MLNTILVEGIVTKGCWRYGGAEFIRLACYPDPDRSAGGGPGASAQRRTGQRAHHADPTLRPALPPTRPPNPPLAPRMGGSGANPPCPLNPPFGG